MDTFKAARSMLVGVMLPTAVLLSGCAQNQVSYAGACMTCMDNPLTGKPLNYDPNEYSNKLMTASASGSGNAQTQSAPQVLAKDSLTFPYKGDVDSTALRIKQTFGFLSKEEAVAEMGNAGKMMFAGPGYAYRATQGSQYFMKTQAYSGDLTATISKQGNGAVVVMKYEQRHSGGLPISAVMAKIKQKTEKALQ